MPMYRFVCQECQETFEQRLAVSELNYQSVQCPNGHQTVKRVFSKPTIIFKGSGWYSKDHAKSVN